MDIAVYTKAENVNPILRISITFSKVGLLLVKYHDAKIVSRVPTIKTTNLISIFILKRSISCFYSNYLPTYTLSFFRKYPPISTAKSRKAEIAAMTESRFIFMPRIG